MGSGALTGGTKHVSMGAAVSFVGVGGPLVASASPDPRVCTRLSGGVSKSTSGVGPCASSLALMSSSWLAVRLTLRGVDKKDEDSGPPKSADC